MPFRKEIICMKKLISIVMSIVLMITMFGAVSVSAEIKFKDSTTFYEEFKNADDVPCLRYYKTIDGIVYSCIDNPDYGLSDAEVIAIMPDEKNSKVEILDEVSFISYEDPIKVTSINIKTWTDLNFNIEEIIIGDNVSNITGINNLPSLKKVTIGKNVFSISDSFHHCENIESIAGATDCPFEVEDGALYRHFGKDKMLVSVFKPVTSYVVKSGVTHFLAPFGKDYTLKTLTLNKELKLLETGELTKLTTLNIDKNIKKFKYVDISGTKLKSVNLSKIRVKAFKAQNVKTLTSVSLPSDCWIEESAFAGCRKLQKVTLGNIKKAPKIRKGDFENIKKGIKFYVKNKKVAKSLNKQLKKASIKNANIYIGKKLIYKG